MNAPVTALVTGGGSGIGEAFARALHAKGSTVIVAGRNEDRLRSVCGDCPGMTFEALDVTDALSVRACADRIAVRHPGLNLLVNNAGIQRLLDFRAGAPFADAAIEEEIDTI